MVKNYLFMDFCHAKGTECILEAVIKIAPHSSFEVCNWTAQKGRRLSLFLSLPVSSADNLWEQFEPISGQTLCRA